MSELVDAVGVQSIAAIIRQSGLQKISISKYGAGKGTIAVFEDNESKTTDRIVKGFTEWAQNILHGNPYNDMVYEVLLYNEPEPEDPDEEDVREKKPVKRNFGKTNKMRFAIQLYRAGSGPQPEKISDKINECAVKDNMNPDKVAEIVKSLLMENEIIRRLTVVEIDLRGLKESIEEVFEEMDELKEEVGQIDGTDTDGTEQENQKYYFDKFVDLLNVKAANGTKLSGTEENDKDTVKANINKAIAILYKHDKKIDQHLLKLANMAETNTELFAQVIAQLEKM